MAEPNARPTEPGSPPEHVNCPFCEQTDTRLINPFGGQLSVAQDWCNRCRTGFDYIKREDNGDDAEF
jgi:hypothetical protein